jgi:hypothetical protein
MNMLNRAIHHITETAKVPSFSSYEERLHPYVHEVFSNISNAKTVEVPINNIIYHINIKAFGKELMKTGTLTADLHLYLGSAFDLRAKENYDTLPMKEHEAKDDLVMCHLL